LLGLLVEIVTTALHCLGVWLDEMTTM
jgi:hypothetical protein